MDTTFASDRSTSQSVKAPPPAALAMAPSPTNLENDPYFVDKPNDALELLEGLHDKVAVTATSIFAELAAIERLF